MAYKILKPEWSGLRPIRGVLFDMDGLVLDTEKLYTRFWMEAARCFGYEMTREQSLGMRGLGGKAGEAQLHSYFGPEVDYLQMRNKRIELMDAFVAVAGVELKPGIRELLDYLDAQGISTAITSSSPLDRIRRYLGQHGLDTRFHRLCSGRDVPIGKPAPDIYLHGAAALGLAPEECLALEDSPAGIESAYRAGCLPVLIPDQDHADAHTLQRIYAMADSLTDVIDIIKVK